VRRELRQHLDAFAGSRILVTHDPVDALVLADRLVVLEGGRITQGGTAADVARGRRRATWRRCSA
jgi:molybdate transport system ATP-binding protein